VGAWAPRPEQVATTTLLNDDAEIDRYHSVMRTQVQKRLETLRDGIISLKKAGFPVDAATPSGAIYLSARFALHGKRTPDGSTLQDDDAVRSYLLHSSGLAAVPFSAFGQDEGSAWFRLSVGAVSITDVQELIPRLKAALGKLS